MTTRSITYRKTRKYKYQLRSDYTIQIEIEENAANDFVVLSADGSLLLKNKYAWDGPSGPAIDTKSFMRGSLVHDALYQLFREGLLDREVYRKTADKILYNLCREDGMNFIRAKYVYIAVCWFGAPTSKPKKKYTKDRTAP